MDRQISKKEQTKTRKKQLGRGIIIFLLICISLYALRNYLKKEVSQGELHIVKVERGDIQNTLLASGKVVAAFERQINAPVSTEIESVLLSNGATVKRGELILELDQEYTRLEYEKLFDALELKKNNISKLKLAFDKDLLDLQYRDEIKSLELEKQEAQLVDQRRLEQIGGSTAEEVERLSLQLKVGKIEKKILENELLYKRNVNVSEKRNLELEYQIQHKSLKELKRKLEETNVKAPISGVITWINEDLGKTVDKGEALVRIADLNKFRVEARCSDRYAEKINIGQEVQVKIGKRKLKGKVDRILPEVVNNTITFLVVLENSDDSGLRPNLQTEVFLVTDTKRDIIKVKKGAVFVGATRQDVFVVRDGIAYKTPIEKGLSNSKYIEIKSGLKPGDHVIISKIDEFDHLDQFKITNK